MSRLYLDIETAGLHGMSVLLQYAVDGGPITLYEPWKNPIRDSLRLIEWFCEQIVVGFNLSFDWFHLCKLYTIFRRGNPGWIPEEHIDEIAFLEPKGQDGPCIKPHSCLDLMLHSRKGPMQSLMARDDIRIKRVPTALAYSLAEELEHRIEIDGIYFAKRADSDAPRWAVYDRKKRNGEFDPDFKDVALRFSPAGGLKFLAEYALKLPLKYQYKDIELDHKYRPIELGYAPTALAVAAPPNWEVYKDGKLRGFAWPGVIKHHIQHWATNEPAREYAEYDIVYTRALDEHFNHPEPNDDDSNLACMVAAVRWRGFRIDIPGIRRLLQGAKEVVAKSPININKPEAVRKYVCESMDEMEKMVLDESTKKANLEAVGKWRVAVDEPCTVCCGAGCSRCDNGVLKSGEHPAAHRANEVLQIKTAAKEVELYAKLLRAKKFHASFVVIGTLSSRMSGADGLNAQGIKRTFDVRSMFPLAWDGMVLSIGDFESFEVTIADAVCNDPELRNDLSNGKKIHAIFGAMLFPDHSYDEIKATKGTENDLYTKGKNSFFAAILYGGNFKTLVSRQGVEEENAKTAIDKLLKRYKNVGEWRKRITTQFSPMTQPGGIGTRVVWGEPADYCETMLGFRRYYTLENKICRALFDLARKPPKEWAKCPVKVLRRDRVQTAGGAVSSALYGAAFNIQSANVRSAANHTIQSVGAQITKRVQRRVWDMQPCGVHDWLVAPCQVHDEIIVVHKPELTEQVEEVIQSNVEAYKDRVPLISMEWKKNAKSWAEK